EEQVFRNVEPVWRSNLPEAENGRIFHHRRTADRPGPQRLIRRKDSGIVQNPSTERRAAGGDRPRSGGCVKMRPLKISNTTFHSPNSYCCCTLTLSHERNPSHSSHSRTNGRSASLAARLAHFLARTFCRDRVLAVRPGAIQAAPAAGANDDGRGSDLRRPVAHRILDWLLAQAVVGRDGALGG